MSLPTLPADSTVTFILLLLAHMLADFPLQTRPMVDHKNRPPVFLTHIALVYVMTLCALGGAWQVALVVALAHGVIDAVKTWVLPDTAARSLTAFLADQGAHLATLIAVALIWPMAAHSGIWADALPYITLPALLIAGYILTVTMGGYVVGKVMEQFPLTQSGLPKAGKVIGTLERIMIYILVLSGQPAGVGFLIAAKSVLRFETAKDDRETSEYVIIGTLASFAWALASASITALLLEVVVQTP